MGQKLIYDGISGNSAIDTRLISPSGENVFDFYTKTWDNLDVSDDINPVTLEETGTYQLIVSGNDHITGDFSFSVGVGIDDRVRKSPYEKTTTPTNPEGD
ncbi:hypothetical protein [Crocosphaera sp.]|uniref:hypothetical protein n=1 Tax=Crocosphaera sp. TaxID=2729996 RepID=UPI00257AE11D|nr:hypothetical protein [Crocosphaera sp.]NQZ65193.1 hypothetical protein [Crocosphaera sp.]